eukprot:scaffold12443_cov108-Isochrysis_galbana.AAC.1
MTLVVLASSPPAPLPRRRLGSRPCLALPRSPPPPGPSFSSRRRRSVAAHVQTFSPGRPVRARQASPRCSYR